MRTREMKVIKKVQTSFHIWRSFVKGKFKFKFKFAAPHANWGKEELLRDVTIQNDTDYTIMILVIEGSLVSSISI